MFFYDCFGGDKIGGVWFPGLRTPKSFKVRERYSSTPVHQVSIYHTSPDPWVDQDTQSKKGGKNVWSGVVLNEATILAEIERMGQGLVKSIVVH